MKKIFMLSGIAVSLQISAQYCSPTFQYGADSNMITHVAFGNINNTSPFQSGTTQVYENFTTISTNVQIGGSYGISVKGPSSTFPSDVVVFIDFNQNGNFNDSGESFYIGRLAAANPANAFTITNNITIPSNALTGITRMRILKNNNIAAYSDPNAPNSIVTACDSTLRSGQTEDYTINILPVSLSTQEIVKEDFKVYPNPVADFVNIQTSERLEKIEIYNLTGQKIWEGNSDKINTDHFIPGNYLIKIQAKNKKNITRKFIKK